MSLLTIPNTDNIYKWWTIVSLTLTVSLIFGAYSVITEYANYARDVIRLEFFDENTTGEEKSFWNEHIPLMKENAMRTVAISILLAVASLISTIVGLRYWFLHYEQPRAQFAKIQLRLAELELSEREKGSAETEPDVVGKSEGLKSITSCQ